VPGVPTAVGTGYERYLLLYILYNEKCSRFPSASGTPGTHRHLLFSVPGMKPLEQRRSADHLARHRR
jgi:hypothetical protein